MFIQTEETPNPQTLKFLPGRDVLGEGRSADFTEAEAAERSPLAVRLFAIDGVEGVFLGSDFITVTKGAGEWQHLKPAILGAIMEQYTSGAPILAGDGDASAHKDHAGDDGEIVAQIVEILDTRVRPAVARDGGDITFDSFEDGVVYLAMQGSCAGCPASTMTLKQGVENLLKHFVPEVTEVRALGM